MVALCGAGALATAALAPAPASAAAGEFSSAGSVTTGRVSHGTALLTTDKVLVVGGLNSAGIPLSSTEVYTPPTSLPGTGSWASSGSLVTARFDHTATRLDSGEALVVGGRDNSGAALDTVERYSSGTWKQSDTGTCLNTISASCPAKIPQDNTVPILTTPAERYHHTATRLTDGTVLVAGGRNSSGKLNTVSRYDPGTGAWDVNEKMWGARARHTATLLSDGKVLVVGGETGAPNAEVYDPATDTWTPTGAMASGGRQRHTATLLTEGACAGASPPIYCGKVLVTGGHSTLDWPLSQNNVSEIYDIVENSWTPTAPLNLGRSDHTATLLPNGNVLVVGGCCPGGSGAAYDEPEVYDPAGGTGGAGAWSVADCSPAAECLSAGRAFHTATRLDTIAGTSPVLNDVIIVGGVDGIGGGYGTTYPTSAERYDS